MGPRVGRVPTAAAAEVPGVGFRGGAGMGSVKCLVLGLPPVSTSRDPPPPPRASTPGSLHGNEVAVGVGGRRRILRPLVVLRQDKVACTQNPDAGMIAVAFVQAMGRVCGVICPQERRS